MAKYLIKKDSHNDSIICINYDLKGYSFKPKMREDSEIIINDVTIINPEMIESVLERKFIKNYRKILLLFFDISENGDNSGENTALALREIDRLKSILRNKYEKFLSREKQLYFLTKLSEIEQGLQRICYYDEEVYEERRCR